MTAVHFKPRLTRLLRALALDIVYERGEGSRLFHRDGDREVAVLDMAGGYGAVLFGHSHPALVAEGIELLRSRRPAHAQGSRRPFAEQLAAGLSGRARGDYCVLFANSGTEAVEAALKHAILETGSRTFIALEGAFHGQTLGALQLTAAASYREPFDLAGLNVIRVAPNDLDALDAAFAAAPDLAGAMIEPVLGEGGVKPLTPRFAQKLAALCAARRVPLIADECQTGFGRTGRFLASESLGVSPDYVILSKALGGGLAKIAALMVTRRRYVAEFDLIHTSTYADDDYSCGVALKALELLDADLLAECRRKGGRLRDAVVELAQEFPDVIGGVRGEGLLLGVDFRAVTSPCSFLLRTCSEQKALGFLLASYLLHTHHVRVAPTLGSALTLRLEPPVVTSDDELDRVTAALRETCERLRNVDTLAITAPLRDRPFVRDGEDHRYAHARIPCDSERFDSSEPAKVAWLFHLIDTRDLCQLEPQFSALSETERETFLDRMAGVVEPTVMSSVDVRSSAGGTVRLLPILLPVTSRFMKVSRPAALVQQGIDLASSLGCSVVSLGQHCSIVTRHGTRVDGRGMTITTGNGFSVALAASAVAQAHAERGTNAAQSTLAIVGAAGNIGQACVELLAHDYQRVLLIGSDRPGRRTRLERLLGRGSNLEISTAAAIGQADVVLFAVNALDAPFNALDLAPDTIVCDLSVPFAIDVRTLGLRPDLHLIDGGIVRLPFNEDLGIDGFPLPRGEVYGCLAEALLLGFEQGQLSGIGHLTAERVQEMARLATAHGFTLLSGVHRRTQAVSS